MSIGGLGQNLDRFSYLLSKSTHVFKDSRSFIDCQCRTLGVKVSIFSWLGVCRNTLDRKGFKRIGESRFFTPEDSCERHNQTKVQRLFLYEF